ncbi:MAG: hypothetical protein M1827_002658 [Pycnora praestabilis]|nr:MAG: hypothetical protein M1827_002658 [Pycnora praestabilis]
MEAAKTLIRSVARAFYPTECILVVDALIIHSALRDDDLAHLLGMQTKQVHKLCGKLREDRLLAVHSRQETREGMQRPVARTYYYIDFHSTIDAIKYRVYHITKHVEKLHQPSEEKKDYFCPRCKSRWTQLEVLDNWGGPTGFLCHKCNNPLERDDESAGNKGGHEKQSRLMAQLDGLLKLMPQIDRVVIPNNDFETALSNAVPVKRDQLVNPMRPTAPIDSSQNSRATVKGLAQTSVPQIEVSLTTSSERTATETAVAAERKAMLAQQNQLPIWHTNSTISGEVTALGSKHETERQASGPAGGFKREEIGEKKPEEEEADIQAIYADLRRQDEENEEKARRKEEEDEETEGDEDDEEGDFEDIGVVGGSGTDTPASSAIVTNEASKSSLTNETAMARLKSQESESGSSGLATGAATPAALTVNGDADDEGHRPGAVKRARIAEPSKEAVLKAQVLSTEDNKATEDSDEDEEAEFEDAM